MSNPVKFFASFHADKVDYVHVLLAIAAFYFVVRAIRLRFQLLGERRHLRRLAANRDCVLNLLGKATETFKDNLDLASFAHYYTDYSARSLHAQSAAFFMYDSNSKTVQAENVVGLFPALFKTPDNVVRTLRSNTQKLHEYLRNTRFELKDTPFVMSVMEQLALLIERDDVPRRMSCPVCECWGMIIAPVIVDNKVFGLMAVANRMDRQPFDAEDFQLAKNLAEMAGITISHIMSLSEIQEKRAVDSQIQTAVIIVKHLLPHEVIESSAFTLSVEYQPAYRLGGDYYDFVRVDDTHIGVLVADVSGKGIPAGLVMATTRSLFSVVSKGETAPAKVLSQLNTHLLRLTPEEMFVSMIYVVFNEKTREMVFARAGHEPPICCSVTKEATIIGSAQGMVVGMVDDETFAMTIQEESHMLSPADVVLLYTDGLTEAQNEKGEEFTRQSVMQELKHVCGLNVDDAMRTLTNKVKKFTGAAPAYDDTTVVMIKAK